MKPWLHHLGLLLFLVAVSRGGVLKEDFSTNPLTKEWSIFGDPSLFQWDASGQLLEVTWDSSRSNSYFHHPLGAILTEKDDFGLELDLQLLSVQVGNRPGKPFTFELALGFQLQEEATRSGFRRGTGQDASNLIELDYFPAQGVISATISPTAISKERTFATGFNFPFELPLDEMLHITLYYESSPRRIKTTITRSGQPLPLVEDVILPASFAGFQIDTVTLSSYSDEGAGGSLIATGLIDNLLVTFPDPPVVELRPGKTPGEILAWMREDKGPYHFFLEKTLDLRHWTTVSSEAGRGASLTRLMDPDPSSDMAFYRVRAAKP